MATTQYTGPDRLTNLPNELLIRISDYLHRPSNAQWDDKADLKAFRLAHSEMLKAGTPALFSYMTLKITYDWQPESHSWTIPKLISFCADHPEFAQHIRAARLQVLPIPATIGRDGDLDPDIRANPARHYIQIDESRPSAASQKHSLLWDRHIHRYLCRIQGSPCLRWNGGLGSQIVRDGPDPFSRDLEYVFDRMFGPVGRAPQAQVKAKEVVNDQTGENRETFSQHVLDQMSGLLERWPTIRHLEVGSCAAVEVPGNVNWRVRYGKAFATVSAFERGALQLHSVSVSSVPDGFCGDMPPPLSVQMHRFCLEHITSNIKLQARCLAKLELNVYSPGTSFGSRDWKPTKADLDWVATANAWSHALNALPNLRVLRLQRITNGGVIEIQARKKDGDIHRLLDELSLPKLRILHLAGWALSPAVLLEVIPACFSNLKILDLEWVRFLGTKVVARRQLLNALKEKIEGLLIGISNMRVDDDDDDEAKGGRS